MKIRYKNQYGPLLEIKTLEDFEWFVCDLMVSESKTDSFNGVQYEEMFNKISDLFCKYNMVKEVSYSKLYREIKNLFGKDYGRKLSRVSYEYWYNRGFYDSEIRERITRIQRANSKRCVEYWINKGFSEKESKIFVSKYQIQFAKQSCKNNPKKEEFVLYSQITRKLTRKNNPRNIKFEVGLSGVVFQLDHKFSIYEGYKQNILPWVIAHKVNLEYIPRLENTRKGIKCSITKEDLFKGVLNES